MGSVKIIDFSSLRDNFLWFLQMGIVFYFLKINITPSSVGQILHVLERESSGLSNASIFIENGSQKVDLLWKKEIYIFFKYDPILRSLFKRILNSELGLVLGLLSLW